ncbi:glycosyltransferase [Saccharibacillus sacchari]|uniref:glycosyltransferase n=1 Tax=Saccharibacillus sacchari TaxID=456493 RepID=UPI0004B977FA|nr:glycosyltransferase [Saccharibacillus sacchari]
MNIVFAADNHYIQHLSVTLTSLLENATHKDKITINIIGKDIEIKNKLFLDQLVQGYGSRIVYKEINPNLLKEAVINGHITEATYYRILIPNLFEADVKKVLYLDCDLVITADIWELWDTELDGHALGAVRIYEYVNDGRVPENATYFNAGVLLINLDKWRSEDLTRKVLEYIKAYPDRLLSWDQDALNGVLYEEWVELPFHWNFRSQLFELNSEQFPFVEKRIFEESQSNPSIVHFTTNSKPWHYMNEHPYKNEYFKYLDNSGYPYTKYKEEAILKRLNYILFGAGLKGQTVKTRLEKKGLRVTGFLDNSPSKWGSVIESLPVLKPDVDNIDFDKNVIVVSSQYEKEISEQLIQSNLKPNEHFFNDIDNLYLLANQLEKKKNRR